MRSTAKLDAERLAHDEAPAFAGTTRRAWELAAWNLGRRVADFEPVFGRDERGLPKVDLTRILR